jgi:hybrid cluster-associated redox disulfide protein
LLISLYYNIFRKSRSRREIMKNTFVNGKTLIGEIVKKYPESVEILLGIGMHCLGCPASQAESLEDACAVHGKEVQPVIDALNEKIAETRQ